jgi:hypothetical protein
LGYGERARPWQLTVRDLRRALETADDDQVVTFSIAPDRVSGVSEAAASGITVIFNVEVRGAAGPVFGLSAVGLAAEQMSRYS